MAVPRGVNGGAKLRDLLRVLDRIYKMWFG